MQLRNKEELGELLQHHTGVCVCLLCHLEVRHFYPSCFGNIFKEELLCCFP